MTGFYVLIFIVSCLILIRSGTLVVKSILRIAQFLGWKEFTVASIIMAFATTLPEIFVGITSAFHQKPQLAFGNVIGSNIIALTLVIGMGAFIGRGIKIEGKTLQRSSLYVVIITFLPLLLIFDGKVSRIDGLILLSSLIFYFHQLYSQEERFSKIFSNHFKRGWSNFKTFLKDMGVFSAGAFLLLISAEGIVFSASNLAIKFNIPLVIIGLFLVALGTSMPEIAFGFRSVMMGHKDMIIGDAMGAVVINSAMALGLVALISPFEIVYFSFYLSGIIFTIITGLFFYIFSRTGKEISRKESLFLIGIYLAFVLFEILTKQC